MSHRRVTYLLKLFPLVDVRFDYLQSENLSGSLQRSFETYCKAAFAQLAASVVYFWIMPGLYNNSSWPPFVLYLVIAYVLSLELWPGLIPRFRHDDTRSRR